MEKVIHDIKQKIVNLSVTIAPHLDSMSYDQLRMIRTNLQELSHLISNKMEKHPDSPSSAFQRGLDWMESEEGQEHMRNYFESKSKIESHQFQRIENFFNTLSGHHLDTAFKDFLKWEEEYEEYWYTQRHTQTTSNIFSVLMKVIRKNGSEHDVDDYNEDFLSDVFTWGNFTFKLYCGQGCFWRITEDDGKVIFQST